LVEAAVRDEYREMGIEEEERAVPAMLGARPGLPPGNGRGTPEKPSIREPQRKVVPAGANNTAVETKIANGSTTGNVPKSGTNGSTAGTETVQGIVGPLEPDASGNTVRRNGKDIEYVVFRMSRNGSSTTLYSNQPEMLPEIARHQGGEAVARVAILRESGRQYYVLNGFVEG
jgi:hypothetical protein